MRVGLDTNIFGYAAGIGADLPKRQRAAWLLNTISPDDLVMPTQVAREFYSILVRKGGEHPKIAQKIVNDWADVVGMKSHAPPMMRSALEGASFRQLQVWDALILEICAEAGCDLLLSEDMHDGLVYRDMIVANPFSEAPQARLEELLATLPTPPA